MLLAVLSSAICHSSSFTSNERLKTKHKKRKVEKKEEEWMRKEWAERETETERNKKLWWTTTPVLIGLSQPFDVTWTTTHTHRTAMKKYNKHIFTHTQTHTHTQKRTLWKNSGKMNYRLLCVCFCFSLAGFQMMK